MEKTKITSSQKIKINHESYKKFIFTIYGTVKKLLIRRDSKTLFFVVFGRPV